MRTNFKSYLHGTRLYRIIGRWQKDLRGKLFDWKHGVRTSGWVALNDLNIKSLNVKHGQPYGGADPRTLHLLFRTLGVLHQDFVLVDLGSGMGRVLLVASEFPFKRIVGVEFAPELHRIAEHNIAHYRSTTQKCREIESVCMDAAQYAIPEDPVIIFLFNPFGEKVLAAVLANIERSLQERPRELLIVYFNPELEYLLERSQSLVKVQSNDWYIVYRGVMQGTARRAVAAPIALE